MFADSQHPEIFDAVVTGVSVNVVDLFVGTQTVPEMRLHDVSVLKHPNAVYGDSFVGPVIVGTLVNGVAPLGAKALGSTSARTDREYRAAHLAMSRLIRGVMGRLTANCRQSRPFYLGEAGLSKARARAEAHERFPYTVSPDAKRLAALLADDWEGHAKIISNQKQAVAIAMSTARKAKAKKGK